MSRTLWITPCPFVTIDTRDATKLVCMCRKRIISVRRGTNGPRRAAARHPIAPCGRRGKRRRRAAVMRVENDRRPARNVSRRGPVPRGGEKRERTAQGDARPFFPGGVRRCAVSRGCQSASRNDPFSSSMSRRKRSFFQRSPNAARSV
ncbi:Hypothetical protein CINCED_3A024427 [Cinara cedri]|uniref:Uncharacterized protein n=1 Tax=Cinara cedri TaxID=506608 RepID=A0A5E4MSV4_9HEMI|nr:Hypothetical protein CINCED_3A024427 [Cinara cedri]